MNYQKANPLMIRQEHQSKTTSVLITPGANYVQSSRFVTRPGRLFVYYTNFGSEQFTFAIDEFIQTINPGAMGVFEGNIGVEDSGYGDIKIFCPSKACNGYVAISICN